MYHNCVIYRAFVKYSFCWIIWNFGRYHKERDESEMQYRQNGTQDGMKLPWLHASFRSWLSKYTAKVFLLHVEYKTALVGAGGGLTNLSKPNRVLQCHSINIITELISWFTRRKNVERCYVQKFSKIQMKGLHHYCWSSLHNPSPMYLDLKKLAYFTLNVFRASYFPLIHTMANVRDHTDTSQKLTPWNCSKE